MNPKHLRCGYYYDFMEEREATLEDLQEEFNKIKHTINNIYDMGLSNQTANVCKNELYAKLKEIKK